MDRNHRMFHHRRDPYHKFKPRHDFEILRRVQSQPGFRKNLIFTQIGDSCDNSYTKLSNAVHCIGSSIQVTKEVIPNSCQPVSAPPFQEKFTLYIDNEFMAEGMFGGKVVAKKELAEIAIRDLERTCFTITRKVHPILSPQVDVPSPSVSSKTPSVYTQQVSTPNLDTPLKGGIGEKLMKQMGWGGGGLGAQEQGRLNPIENHIQVDRQGLGSKNIAQEVTKILQRHVASKSINSLAFSSDFSKEERMQIHKIAAKLNIKSRSYGTGDGRTLVVQSKMRQIDLVRHLLEVGGENEQFKLVLPTDMNNI